MQKAFTLIESLVATVIFSVIAVASMVLIINSLHSYYTLNTLNELNNTASFAMDEILKDIQQSGTELKLVGQIFDPATGDTRSILVLPFTNQPDNSTGKPIWHGIIAYYPFKTDDGINQIRKYVYNQVLSADAFPLTVSVTGEGIDIFRQDSLLLCSFDRSEGYERALANYISESPVYSNVNFEDNDDTVSIRLFFEKAVTVIGGLSKRQVSLSLNSTAALRN
jgi:prepilin-type N-terminal cleavage/methylation domain-containing protein